jgi:hypothetical protein
MESSGSEAPGRSLSSVRAIDEVELLSMLENMTIGASDELERIRSGAEIFGSRDQAIGYYEGRIDAWKQLHTQLSRELAGKAEAPRFFIDSDSEPA